MLRTGSSEAHQSVTSTRALDLYEEDVFRPRAGGSQWAMLVGSSQGMGTRQGAGRVCNSQASAADIGGLSSITELSPLEV